VNYPSTDLADPALAYWSFNYARLQRIKKMYDPTDLFSHAQSVKVP
jgi:FAD/FMN-containing dehydrogenase